MPNFKSYSIVTGAAALLATGLLAATPAQAILFDLTSDHCSGTGGCGTAPFGTVDVTQVGANTHIVVDLANGPPNTISWAQTGAGDFQLFKFNATGVVLGDISVVQTFAGQNLQANTGTFNGDGTGPFDFGISCTTCGNGSLGITSNVDFTVANATIAELTASNGPGGVGGNIFVADVFSGQTGNTGPVDVVPAPILGHGLLALLAIGGVLSGSRLLESLKKHRLHAA
jgi:hypothetical protein